MWIMYIFVPLFHKFKQNNSQLQVMKKTSSDFSFHYPLKHKVVRNLRIVTEHVGDLVIEGKGYFNPAASVFDLFERYQVDIDYIRWNGTDIKAVLEVTGTLEAISEAAVRYFAASMENAVGKAA